MKRAPGSSRTTVTVSYAAHVKSDGEKRLEKMIFAENGDIR